MGSTERGPSTDAGWRLRQDPEVTAIVAAHDQGDWELRVKVNGKEVKKQAIDHDGERWKTVTADLSDYAGQEVTIQLEGAATGWAWEFGYWAEVRLE